MCHEPRIHATDYTVRLRRTEEGWRADLFNEDGILIDMFPGHTPNEALADVHREHPWATYDPDPEE